MVNVEVRDGVGIVQQGDTLIVVWNAAPVIERWRYQLNRMEMLAVSHEDGILCLVLIASTAPPPDAEVRRQMTADYRRMGAKVRTLVVVPLGNSLWLSVVRTIVRGILILSGHGQRQRVAGTVTEGLEHLLQSAGPATPAKSEIVEALDALSSALGILSMRAA